MGEWLGEASSILHKFFPEFIMQKIPFYTHYND